jgi:hypothetical protein
LQHNSRTRMNSGIFASNAPSSCAHTIPASRVRCISRLLNNAHLPANGADLRAALPFPCPVELSLCTEVIPGEGSAVFCGAPCLLPCSEIKDLSYFRIPDLALVFRKEDARLQSRINLVPRRLTTDFYCQRRRIMEFKKAGVEWEHSFEEATERAKREQKPVLLDFFKDG